MPLSRRGFGFTHYARSTRILPGSPEDCPQGEGERLARLATEERQTGQPAAERAHEVLLADLLRLLDLGRNGLDDAVGDVRDGHVGDVGHDGGDGPLLAGLARGQVVRAVYYDRDAYVELTGCVARIDLIYRTLTIVETTIALDDLRELEVVA